MKQLYLVLIILCSFSAGHAQQMSIQFFPEIDGRNLQGLFNARIINGAGTAYGALTITVRKGNSRLCEISTKNFRINSGLNLLPSDAVKGARYQFANTNEGRLLAKAGIFPTGELEYCYTLTLYNPFAEGNPQSVGEVENCFDLDLMPLSPLSLSSPYDGEKICDIKPIFSWLPSLPVISGSQYKILCVKVKPGQSGVEALKYNLAMISTGGLQSPVFPFPANVASLSSGDRYAWQVIQYASDVVINKSEVWMFEVGCEDMDENSVALGGDSGFIYQTGNDNVGKRDAGDYDDNNSNFNKKGNDKDKEKGFWKLKGVEEDNTEEKNRTEHIFSYRLIENLRDGNFEMIKGFLRFSTNNLYIERPLKYEIIPISVTHKRVKPLPVIILKKGLNFIEIDLSDKGLENGEDYLLIVDLGNGDIKKLRFKYENE